MSKPRTIAIIPARGGSERIPQKNLAPLAGVPLLVFTVEAALAATEIDEVYVSTDDDDIALVARESGACVIDRPAALATSYSPSEDALIHAVESVEATSGPVSLVVMLQVTSPLRGARRIDEAVSLLRLHDCDSVVSVTPDKGYYFLGTLQPNGELQLGYDPERRLRTQDIPPRYRENGAIYVMTRDLLLRRRCRMGGRLHALVMSEEESVDIDTPLDLQICESLLAQREGVSPRAAAALPLAVLGKRTGNRPPRHSNL